jgi:hypothetical protein
MFAPLRRSRPDDLLSPLSRLAPHQGGHVVVDLHRPDGITDPARRQPVVRARSAAPAGGARCGRTGCPRAAAPRTCCSSPAARPEPPLLPSTLREDSKTVPFRPLASALSSADSTLPVRRARQVCGPEADRAMAPGRCHQSLPCVPDALHRRASHFSQAVDPGFDAESSWRVHRSCLLW